MCCSRVQVRVGYLQADVSVAVLQLCYHLTMRQVVHRPAVDTDDPVPHLTHTQCFSCVRAEVHCVTEPYVWRSTFSCCVLAATPLAWIMAMKMGMSPRGLPFPPAMLTPRESLTPCGWVPGDRVIVNHLK